MLKGLSALLRGTVKLNAGAARELSIRFHTPKQTLSLQNISRTLYSTNTMSDIIFRQLLDYDSFTYTYLVGDTASREAVIIDPVKGLVDRDAKLIEELDLKLKYSVNTHMHADHVTGTGCLKKRFDGCLSVIGKESGADADVHLADEDVLRVGKFHLKCLSTPGHTDGCMSFHLREKDWVFTGDALFVRGCGRVDFQQGSPEKLYKSVHDKIFSLHDDCLVYPGHDYNGHTVSSVGEEKKYNPRLSKSLEEFTKIMNNLNLKKPKHIDEAIPANQRDGL